jgi:hypothetical protein
VKSVVAKRLCPRVPPPWKGENHEWSMKKRFSLGRWRKEIGKRFGYFLRFMG